VNTALLAAAQPSRLQRLARRFPGREWSLRRIDLQRLRWPEFWPAWLFYLPLLPCYAWLSLRFRGILLPSRSNPGIHHGGLINESKDSIFKLLPKHPSVLAWKLHPAGSRPRLRRFPVIAKPDAGQRGSGVRLCRSQSELEDYAENADFSWLSQDYCPWMNEAGVFYVRLPSQSRGRIFSVTKKVFPFVEGDGRRSLAELILADPRNRHMARVFFKRHAGSLDEVLPLGRRFRLVESGNHCQGTVFLEGKHLATEALSSEIDRIARAMPGFYIGRFDIRYRNEETLKLSKGFKIIEVNGASSEATHIYDPSLSLAEIYSTLFEQWRLVFEAGTENRKRGVPGATLAGLLSDFVAYRRSSRRHPLAS
jgi:hypothetical protein